MENILLKYMSHRWGEEQTNNKTGIRPVITISRDYGCYASEIAEKLSQALNEINQKEKRNEKWQWLSKEILEEAARECEAKPETISHIFGAEEKGFLAEVAVSFSNKQYTSDVKIKKTINQVVRSFCEKGNVIIVGRAGCMIARDFPHVLHIKLMAPYDWRVNQAKTHYNLANDAAMARVRETDQKRAIFMSYFKGNKADSEIFDIILNRSTMNTNEIVATIVKAMEAKEFI